MGGGSCRVGGREAPRRETGAHFLAEISFMTEAAVERVRRERGWKNERLDQRPG